MIYNFLNNTISSIKSEFRNTSILCIEGLYFEEKSHLIRVIFPDYEYLSFENEHLRKIITEDPFRFFNIYNSKVIFDAIELVPNFLKLIETYAISIYQSENYILISNQIFDKNLKADYIKHFKLTYPQISDFAKSRNKFSDLEDNIINDLTGLFPNFSHKKNLNFIFENLIFNQIHAKNQEQIVSLLQLCAENSDKTLNLNKFAKTLNVSQPTILKWLNLFKTYGLISLLNPLEVEFGKRIMRSPKIYFAETSLLCHLLKIKSKKELISSEFFLAIFNNYIFISYLKLHESRSEDFYFWKESNGHEVKFLIKNPTSYDIFEFTTTHEYKKSLRKELDFFDVISEGKVLTKTLIYSGFKLETKDNLHLVPWKSLT